MNEVILNVDAALAVVTVIRDGLTGLGIAATVGTRVPNPRPTRLVYVRRVGGTRRTVVVDDAVLSVECWATSEEDAHDLAQYARAVLHAAAGTTQDGAQLYRITEIGGPALLPDPESTSPRFVASYEVQTRGAAA